MRKPKPWLITASIFVLVALTAALNGLIVPSLLSSVSGHQYVGVTRKVDGVALQGLLEGPKEQQLVVRAVQNMQDAENMAKQYEKLIFDGHFRGSAIRTDENTNAHYWLVELRPQQSTSSAYDAGCVYLIRENGKLMGFVVNRNGKSMGHDGNPVDTEQSIALNNRTLQLEARRAADDLLFKLGYQGDYIWEFNEFNGITVSRLWNGKWQPMYLTFFRYEDKIYISQIKSNWTD
jgi:hypothetical protein